MCHFLTKLIEILLHTCPYAFLLYLLKWESSEHTGKNRAARQKDPEFLNYSVKGHLQNTIIELLNKQEIKFYFIKPLNFGSCFLISLP